MLKIGEAHKKPSQTALCLLIGPFAIPFSRQKILSFASESFSETPSPSSPLLSHPAPPSGLAPEPRSDPPLLRRDPRRDPRRRLNRPWQAVGGARARTSSGRGKHGETRRRSGTWAPGRSPKTPWVVRSTDSNDFRSGFDLFWGWNPTGAVSNTHVHLLQATL